jgi:hypothetical protein
MLVSSLAQAQRAAWLRERFDVEWVVAAGGLRAAVANDPRAPGFNAVAGGGEIILGFDVGAGLAIVADGRVLAGEAGGPAAFFEALGGLALQLRVGRARLRAGSSAGQARWQGDTALLVGGFLASSIDVIPLGGGRLSTTVSLRLDVDGSFGTLERFPNTTMAIALGLGVRY